MDNYKKTNKHICFNFFVLEISATVSYKRSRVTQYRIEFVKSTIMAVDCTDVEKLWATWCVFKPHEPVQTSIKLLFVR